jgi:hypothetical protein
MQAHARCEGRPARCSGSYFCGRPRRLLARPYQGLAWQPLPGPAGRARPRSRAERRLKPSRPVYSLATTRSFGRFSASRIAACRFPVASLAVTFDERSFAHVLERSENRRCRNLELIDVEPRSRLPFRGSRAAPFRARLRNCTTLTPRKDRQRVHDDGLGAESGRPLDMSAVAELVCQSCGKITRSKVPRRTDTMPACPCGGRRQIVRIRHRLHSGNRLGEPTDERAQR